MLMTNSFKLLVITLKLHFEQENACITSKYAEKIYVSIQIGKQF